MLWWQFSLVLGDGIQDSGNAARHCVFAWRLAMTSQVILSHLQHISAPLVQLEPPLSLCEVSLLLPQLSYLAALISHRVRHLEQMPQVVLLPNLSFIRH